jgi:hypothetical protein
MGRNNAKTSQYKTTSGKAKLAAISRRSLLKGAAGAAFVTAGAHIAGGLSARSQVGGLELGPVVLTFRLPSGSLDYLDRKQYIHNMEIISHLSGPSINGGERLTALWAKGKQRLLPGNGGFIDKRREKSGDDDRNPRRQLLSLLSRTGKTHH